MFNKCDIIQYHNRYIYFSHLWKFKIDKKKLIKKPSFILYHSFPEITDNYKDVIMTNPLVVILKKLYARNSLSIFLDKSNSHFIKYISPNKTDSVKQMVIGQYQATLKEYENYKIMRNIIDFNNKNYNLEYPIKNKIVIGYSPTITKQSKRSPWETKGFNRTIEILKKVSKLKNVECDIITNETLNECIKRKAKCNIIIDECVTSSFHRSGLEGLALGKMTICSLGEKEITIIQKTSTSNKIPFENIWIDNLENELKKIICTGSEYINNKGKENRAWMEKYWNPEVITNEYIEYYNNNS